MFNKIKRLSLWLITILMIHLIQSLLVMPAPAFANGAETNANRSNVYSFGGGHAGKLGHGDEENQVSPKPIDGLSDIQAVAAGGSHSLVLTVTGDVYSFGDGAYGGLGHGDTNHKLMPTKIENLPKIKAIAAGHRYSLVLTELATCTRSGTTMVH